jgi:eukaryotic-like serine/threonine-protein kinase
MTASPIARIARPFEVKYKLRRPPRKAPRGSRNRLRGPPDAFAEKPSDFVERGDGTRFAEARGRMQALKTPTDPNLGRLLGGRFEVTELLGEGSMGAVYRGRIRGTLRQVAIKIMLPRLIADKSMLARFQREAEAARRVKHPNAVEVYEHGVEGDRAYLVMELLEGKDLFALLADNGRLSEDRAARILIQICGALGAAHENGFVHRDLKPENVMVLDEPGDRVKILDFGIAKEVFSPKPIDVDADSEDLDTSAITTAGALIGTPAYMAPEQCLAGCVDARTDVYACGVLLYQLLTGRVPFEHDNPMAAWLQHLNDDPRPPSELRPGLNPALEAAILKAMSKRPIDRQQSARELRVELLKALPHLSKDEPAGAIRPSISPRAISPLPFEGAFDTTLPPSSRRSGSHVRQVSRASRPDDLEMAATEPETKSLVPLVPHEPCLFAERSFLDRSAEGSPDRLQEWRPYRYIPVLPRSTSGRRAARGIAPLLILCTVLGAFIGASVYAIATALHLHP